MATIDLGKIKLVWRGTYNNGTAYTVDDVVQYTDSGLVSSYICTTNSTGNAPSSSGTAHGSWAYLAKGGAAGTDVGTTITTQGDVLYRDGSGLQRLAKGTAGQVLKMNSGATAPEWGTDVGGKIGQIVTTIKTDTASVNATTYTDMAGLSIAITPTATSSKILLMGSLITMNVDQYCYGRVVRDIGGGGYSVPTYWIGVSDGSRIQSLTGNLYHNPDGNRGRQDGFNLIDTPNTTSACTYKMQYRQSSGSYTIYLNRSSTDANSTSGWRSVSTLVAMEILA